MLLIEAFWMEHDDIGIVSLVGIHFL